MDAEFAREHPGYSYDELLMDREPCTKGAKTSP